MNSTTSVPVADIVAALKVRYPAAVCALDWGGQHDSDPETRRRNGWRLLVMARLSAQCTDARVNQVCRELFRLYPTPGALAAAPQADVEKAALALENVKRQLDGKEVRKIIVVPNRICNIVA